MTSHEIRQGFLDFFKEKEHTIVPSASLVPTSPNLQFTNAGMNQFVPYFLGTQKAPYQPPRAADTQKCVRAGGKHNDLEDVGYDTYHHTFFEMLGNWSFGDYFKEEAIQWAWELLVERWGFPPARLFATVYKPGDGDPGVFDQDAYDHWKALFEKAGLDPDVHIVDGNVKDNFWMMGDTGPCGPCSEIHMDLTPEGDTRGSLVNADDPRCIEIWNLVFIQYNAEADGSYHPLPSRHVDTGMGFERVCAVVQGTGGFADFSRLASNYDTDVFAPLFARLEELTGKTYQATVPAGGSREGLSEQEQVDVAFRVIADHVRTVSFAIADGIEPGNKEASYTVKGILRRAVRFGRILGFSKSRHLLNELVPVLIDSMGSVFPELEKRKDRILEVLTAEESSFNRTLDHGLKLFDEAAASLAGSANFPPGKVVKLWETHGFPVDLTRLLIDERGLKVDEGEVERLIQKHKGTGSEGQDGEAISALKFETNVHTDFVGYEKDSALTIIHQIVDEDERLFAIVDTSPFYVEMGGQVGDIGKLRVGDEELEVRDAVQFGRAIALEIDRRPSTWREQPLDAEIEIDTSRRRDIEKHHTATHIFHWALHEAVTGDATQQGSHVGPDRLRFDFNCTALTPEQIREVEKLANARIADDDPVTWTEVPHSEIGDRKDVMQFFGDKYGELVRVVQIGGEKGALDGWSMELCGGTHVRKTGEIGLFKIRKEEAIAAGIRRIEAVCGDHAVAYLTETADTLKAEIDELHGKLSTLNLELEGAHAAPVPIPESDQRHYETLIAVTPDAAAGIERIDAAFDALTAQRNALKMAVVEADKRLKKQQSASLAQTADKQITQLIESAATADGTPVIAEAIEGADGNLLQEFVNGLKKRQFSGVAVLAAPEGDKVHLGIYVAPGKTGDYQAGKLMQELAPIVDGRGGGKPEMARGAGNDPSKVPDLLEKARALLM